MTSTSVTTIGGVVVVTQVLAKDEKSIPLQAADGTTPQAPPPAATTPPSPTKVDDVTATFLRAGPLQLGIVQISIGLLCGLFGVTAAFSPALVAHAPFSLTVVFVVSGSLAVAAARRTSVGLLWASLLSHILSASIALAGVTYVCWLLAVRQPSDPICGTTTNLDPRFRAPNLPGLNPDYGSPDDISFRCYQKLWAMNTTVFGLLGLLLVLQVLQVCVAVTVCVFSGKAIRRHDHYSPIMAFVDHRSDVALLDSDAEDDRHTASP